mmetsp:Transcript_109839/g.311474  ORF Transcript_109839/g.311474 Transcript_109839/m.311474 type:complete len:403 (-) Transcript_109839:741-1949(-)
MQKGMGSLPRHVRKASRGKEQGFMARDVLGVYLGIWLGGRAADQPSILHVHVQPRPALDSLKKSAWAGSSVRIVTTVSAGAQRFRGDTPARLAPTARLEALGGRGDCAGEGPQRRPCRRGPAQRRPCLPTPGGARGRRPSGTAPGALAPDGPNSGPALHCSGRADCWWGCCDPGLPDQHCSTPACTPAWHCCSPARHCCRPGWHCPDQHCSAPACTPAWHCCSPGWHCCSPAGTTDRTHSPPCSRRVPNHAAPSKHCCKPPSSASVVSAGRARWAAERCHAAAPMATRVRAPTTKSATPSAPAPAPPAASESPRRRRTRRPRVTRPPAGEAGGGGSAPRMSSWSGAAPKSAARGREAPASSGARLKPPKATEAGHCSGWSDSQGPLPSSPFPSSHCRLLEDQ